MKISVLASGSKGNCTYIETENTKTLIDLGMSNLYIEKSLLSMGINPDQINGIFITHTHVDHIAGLKVFMKKHHPTLFLTKKMYDELSTILEIKEYVIMEDKIVLNDLIVEFFKTSHDAPDSVGYIFKNEDKEFVYVTDTGYIHTKNFSKIANKNIYVFESNHDVEMLMNNEHYPYYTKQRILSDKGHLSNKDSAYYLSKFVGSETKYIVLAHLSEQNNNPELAYNTIKEKLNNENIKILIASQNEKTELLEI